MNKDRYISMFKINGTPILPPLMTAARRREMLAYKELAMALETRLKLEGNHESMEAHDLESISTIEDEYLKVSSLLQDHFSPSEVKNDKISALQNPDFLKKSDTFIYDIQTNTVIIPDYKQEVIGDSGNTRPTRFTGNTRFSNIYQMGMTDSSGKKTATTRPALGNKQQKLIRHIVPQISVKPSTPEATSKNLGEKFISSTPNSHRSTIRSYSEVRKKPPKRASTSPSLKDCPPSLPVQPLVRSNSFTLDSPSPVLLEHLVRNHSKNVEAFGNYNTNSPKESAKLTIPCTEGIASKATPLKRPIPVAKTSAEQPKLTSMLITNSNMFKNKKSPYELKMNGKSKLLKKHKMPLKKISSITLKPRLSTSHHRSKVLNSGGSLKAGQNKVVPTDLQFDAVQQKFHEIEERHRLKLMELMKRQQNEQREMQATFERQQKLLLDEFNAGLMSLQIPSVLKLESDAESSSHTNNNNNDYKNNLKKTSLSSIDGSEYYDMADTTEIPNSPRCNRRLFNDNASSPPPPTPKGSKLSNSRIPSPSRRRIEMAATTINAYAKGYLVRRLFNTDHIQNIVQTIRDTLLFVLDFHRETENDTTVENISLKSRLLQQLTSSCNSLHTVFFKISTKERMEIIAKDRNYIQTKTKGLNRYKLKGQS